MSVSFTKTAASAMILALLTGNVLAQTAPLALPPSMDNAAPVAAPPPQQPQAMGLALPPTETAAMPVIATPSLAPPSVTPPIVAGTAAPQPPAIPVETKNLTDIKPDSVGLLANNEGGLGAGLWKGTSRAVVERFLPMLTLPLPYASLNNLAERFLLTTAAAPEGNPASGNNQNLTALRIDKLLALGNATEAWKLARVAGDDQIDDNSLRQVAEFALVTPAASDVCAKLPEIVKKHTSLEWQKLLLVCQLQAKDTKAAQISLDLLHAQNISDDVFFALVEKNILEVNKNLPRQLTPLRPLILALLRMTDLPLRGEVFARPQAAMIPELLKAKAVDNTARLALAERAASKGIISASDLTAVYTSQTFTPEMLTGVSSSGEQGPMLRALLYQASQTEKNPKARFDEAARFLHSLDANILGGSVLPVLGEVLGDITPSDGFNESSATIARIYVLAGSNDKGLAWLNHAHGAARGMPQVAADLQNLWPLAAISGFESDKDFAKNLDAWLGSMLASAQPGDGARAQKTAAANILMLLDALGFPVGQDAWAMVGDTAAYERLYMPPALVMERLRGSAATGHKGEALLMGMLATTGGKDEPPLLATLETIHALRAIGLTGDAGYLAKDVALRVLNPTVRP